MNSDQDFVLPSLEIFCSIRNPLEMEILLNKNHVTYHTQHLLKKGKNRIII